jgi:3-oxoacyl-[acyl-carrier-protein] synthase II
LPGFTSCQALSLSQDPQAASLPFDRRRAGFVMGEGAAVLILVGGVRPRHGARAQCYCEISGYGNTCDAYHVTARVRTAPARQGPLPRRRSRRSFAGGSGLYQRARHRYAAKRQRRNEAIKLALGREEAYRAMVSSTKSMTGICWARRARWRRGVRDDAQNRRRAAHHRL